MKTFSLQKYLNAPAQVEKLTVQVEELQRDNDSLRTRIVAAQKEKSHALKRAEEFRVDKEKLRQQIVELKRSLQAQQRVNDQLGTKILDLRVALEAVTDENP